ncbi:MAG: hypothetical protein RLZZ488_2369 [Pseudomonadota bacterium]|jgi:uncharacterized protein (DUF2141 family)
MTPNVVAATLALTVAVSSPSAIAANAWEGPTARLNVKLNYLNNKNGSICVSLFSSEDGFPDDGQKAALSKCVSAQELSENAELALDVPNAGSFALALFHDENMDSKLNTGAFGIPLEGFAFSNNPKIRFSAPKFAECAVAPTDGVQTLSIDMKYFLRLPQ